MRRRAGDSALAATATAPRHRHRHGHTTPHGPEHHRLLALLACHDAPVARSQLADWLWPEREPAEARRNLRKVLLQAHRLCSTLAQAPPLELVGAQLRWRPASDLHEFLHACDGPDAMRAVLAYRPSLLAGLDAGLSDDALEWLARQRAWLDERWHAAARRWLAQLQHTPQAQAAAAEQILAHDPLDEAALRALLQACTALGSMFAGCSFTHAQNGLLLTQGLDTVLGQRFLDRFQDNPTARAMLRVRLGQGVSPMQITDPRALQRTAFHQEILRPQGIRDITAIRVPMDAPFNVGGVSICFAGPHAGEQAAQAAHLLEHLAPYLQRALAALLRWRRLPQAETLAAGLDGLPGAVFILSANGRVLFANARAEALLSVANALCLRAGRLAAAQPADAPRLDALLADAAQAPRRLTTWSTGLRLHRPAGSPALTLRALPMHDGQDRLQLPGRAAVLVLADEVP